MSRSTRWFVLPLASCIAVLSASGRLGAQVAGAPYAVSSVPALVAPMAGEEQQSDSLYREAQALLRDGDYRRAATMFRRFHDRYPSSANAPNALYYEAFALSRSGRSSDLRSAIDALETLASEYPRSTANRGDAANLKVRVCGDLARLGDERCAREVATTADPDRNTRTSTSTSASGSTQDRTSCPREDDENDERIMALNALLSTNAESALPILERVLERRDECSVALRKKAVFLVSNKGGSRAADILLRVARNDPSDRVREDAIFWLGNTRDPRVVDILVEMIDNSSDPQVQEKAIFSLSNTGSARGQQALRDIAGRDRAPKRAREQAIFWLGQRRNADNVEFLKSLYTRLTDDDLKEKVLFSLSQQSGNSQWLMDVALNEREDIEMRKKALFWAGQQGRVDVAGLAALYDRVRENEMKEQIIFVLSQRRDAAAVDKLMDIARRDPNRDRRQNAIFWLGQSRDPRVLKFLEELINK
jgi:TolA-binding protein